MTEIDTLMTPEQVSERVKMSVAALAQMRYLGTGPVYVKLSARAVRYRNSDLEAWLQSAVRVQTGRDHGAA